MSSILRVARCGYRRLACQVRFLSSASEEAVNASNAMSPSNARDAATARNILRTLNSRVATLDPNRKNHRIDETWNYILKNFSVDVAMVNLYLQVKLDSSVPMDCLAILESLVELGVHPDERTYGLLINKACADGDMEQTKVLLRHLKASNLDITRFIFSSILCGYIKAGCPEELESTKEIMSRFGMWPSRSGYYGILSGYARIGDLHAFNATAKEAATLYPESLLTDLSLVRLYLLLMKNVPDSKDTCQKVLSLFPGTFGSSALYMARSGVISLVQCDRPIAALQLFKQADPRSCSDLYLISLVRYLRRTQHANLISRFFDLTGIPDPRLNLLLRRAENSTFSTTEEPPSANDVDGLFKCAPTVELPVLAKHVVPRLLSLGVPPQEIVQKIEPRTHASVAAMACVFHLLCPPDQRLPSVLKLDEALALSQEFSNQGVLPVTDSTPLFITRRACMRNNLIATAKALNIPVGDVFDTVLKICSNCFSSEFLKPFVSRLVGQWYETALNRYNPAADEISKTVIQALVNKCLSEKIEFRDNSWVLYALEQFKIPEETLEKLRGHSMPTTKVDSLLDVLSGSSQKEAVEG